MNIIRIADVSNDGSMDIIVIDGSQIRFFNCSLVEMGSTLSVASGLVYPFVEDIDGDIIVLFKITRNTTANRINVAPSFQIRIKLELTLTSSF